MHMKFTVSELANCWDSVHFLDAKNKNEEENILIIHHSSEDEFDSSITIA